MIMKPDGTKEFNRKLIFAQIRQQDLLSRSDLVTATGLSKAAVSAIVADLIAAGLVEEIGSQSSPVGRPRISLAVAPNAGLVLGAELTDQECRVTLTDLRATPLHHVVHPVDSTDLSAPSLLACLQRCVAEATAGVDQTKVIGMGLTVPGIVNPTVGTVLLSVILPWRDLSLVAELAHRFPYPVGVFSRGSAATWGERWYGAGQQVHNLLYLRISNGIVGGLVINGQPYLGQGFGAGELGHMTVQPDGALCRCGNRGCLSTVATTDALLNRVRELLRGDRENALWRTINHHPEQLTLQHVIAAVAQSNRVVHQALEEVAAWLAIALAAAVNLLNLDLIIVGGPLMAVGEALLTPLRRALHQRALPTHLARLQVVASALREHAPAIGAASLMLHALTSPTPSPLLPAAVAEQMTLFA